MPKSKIYALDEWNEGVASGEITTDFDHEKLKHETLSINIPIKKGHTARLDMVTVPISCPQCSAKMWQIALKCLQGHGNVNSYFGDTDIFVRCMTCAWKGFRKFAGGGQDG